MECLTRFHKHVKLKPYNQCFYNNNVPNDSVKQCLVNSKQICKGALFNPESFSQSQKLSTEVSRDQKQSLRTLKGQ